MTRRGKAVVAGFIALLIALALAGEAYAHASLVKASPADGAVVPVAPAVLSLTFNEPVSPLVIRLIGPDGASIEPSAVVAENNTVTVTAAAPLQRGTHVLSWRVISSDGHPVGGSLLFSIGAPSVQPAAEADRGAERGVLAAVWVAKVVLYAALFAGIGGASFCAWIADPVSRRRSQPWLLMLLAAGLVAAPASVALQGVDALELPLSGLAQKVSWQTGLETSYGPTAITAAFALFAGFFACVAESARIARGLALLGLFGVGLALSLSGHASTAVPQFVSRPALFLHAVCVAFWIGALLPLALGVRDAGMRATPSGGGELRRFSNTIVPVIALLLLTGLWLAFVQLDRIDALWTTSYGRVLACKLAAVVAMFALAAANRCWLVPKFETKGGASARPLAISIALELVIALVILGLVALWRFTPPPRALVVDAPVSVHVHGEKAMAQIEIERAKQQSPHASVLVLDGAFQPLAAKEVTLVLANPAAGIEPIRINATRAGASGGANDTSKAASAATSAATSTWRIDDLRIPVAGRWNLRVEILMSDFEKRIIEDTVTLPRVP
jgi:copper transport protein